MTQTFKVYSSHGEILVDKQTGNVIELDQYPTSDELTDIVKFDVEEYQNTYKTDIPDHVDILDLGCWMKDGAYDGPVWSWRD